MFSAKKIVECFYDFRADNPFVSLSAEKHPNKIFSVFQKEYFHTIVPSTKSVS